MANLGEIWLTCHKNIAKAVALMYTKKEQLQEAYAYIVASHDVPTEVDMLYQLIILYSTCSDDIRRELFKQIVDKLVNLARRGFVDEYNGEFGTIDGQLKTMLTLNEFLEFKNYKISQVILDVFAYSEDYIVEYPTQINDDSTTYLQGVEQLTQEQQTRVFPSSYVDENRILQEGYWEFDTTVDNMGCSGNYYDFQLEVATDPDFNNILNTLNTATSALGWYYEDAEDTEGNIYYNFFPDGGLYKEYIGRKVKFISPPNIIDTTNMGRGDIYYIRLTRRADSGTCGYAISHDVIYS